jgi:NADH-quinone oxidoreductase subunit L
MHGDPGYPRFFSFLSLFAAMMFVLVLADNFLLLFIGWEGVGLCSYLLIGYYMTEHWAANAGMKAFIVNRIGDFGFILGMALIFATAGTLDFGPVFANAPSTWGYNGAIITAITLLLFVGATGKSAQIPLFVWLPDAMAGPTPVSALIHAATMVTAGVYMLARANVLYTLAPITMGVVAGVGAATAFVAATIGLTQRDLKKILAYSTVSQLGFMFLAVGVGAFSTGILHLYTHAFFKAGLFLGAGSVMHALGGELDIFKMGGLRRALPITWITYLAATLAISGCPFTAGFFSKDEILWKAASFNQWYGPVLWAVGGFTALLTAIYMFRTLFMVFHGESRVEAEAAHHLHESPPAMTIPLILLAVGSIGAGWIALPEWLGGSWFDQFLAPVTRGSAAVAASHEAQASHAFELAVTGVSVLIFCLGLGIGYLYYVKRFPELPARTADRLEPLYALSYHRWWWDDLYNAVVVTGMIALARIAGWFDTYIIDGIVNGTGRAAAAFGDEMRRSQNGRAQYYALGIFLGVNLILFLLFRQELGRLINDVHQQFQLGVGAKHALLP